MLMPAKELGDATHILNYYVIHSFPQIWSLNMEIVASHDQIVRLASPQVFTMIIPLSDPREEVSKMEYLT